MPTNKKEAIFRKPNVKPLFVALDKADKAVETALGAPAYYLSGGNVPRGFSDQVTEATRPVLGKYAPVAGFAAGVAQPVGRFSKAAKVPHMTQEVAKALSFYKDYLVDALQKSHGRLNPIAETRAAEYVQFLKETKKPTFNDMRRGAEILRSLGAKKIDNVADYLERYGR